MRMFALFGVKNLEFFEIYGVRTDGWMGLSQCGQGGDGSVFRDFVQVSFMDGP